MDGGEPCRPLLFPFGDVETLCYWPDQIDLAEGRLPFAPISPVPIVQRRARLYLTQIVRSAVAGQEPSTATDGIAYLFGSPPGGGPALLDPSPPEPPFVLVSQIPGRRHGRSGLHRVTYHTAFDDAEDDEDLYGDWRFSGNLPGGEAQFQVVGNLRVDVIEAIGRSLVEYRGG